MGGPWLRRNFGQMINRDSTTRKIGVVLIIDQVAAGAFYPLTVVYLTGVKHFMIGTVGLFLTLAGLVGLAVSPLLGEFSDRYGSQRVVAMGNLLVGMGYFGLLYANGVVVLLVSLLLISTSQRIYWASWPVFVADQARDEREIDVWLGMVTALKSAGLGAGALVAGLALGIAGRAAIKWFLVATVLASLVSAVVFWSVRPSSIDSRPKSVRSSSASNLTAAIRGVPRPFWWLVGANSVITVVWLVPALVIPYVLSRTTSIWPGLASVIFAVNTLLIVFFQTSVSSEAQGFARTRVVLLGCVVFLLAVGVLGVISFLPMALAVVAAVVGIAVYSFGEMLVAPAMAAMALAYGGSQLRGRYSALFQTSWSVSAVLGPGIIGILLGFNVSFTWVTLWLLVAVGGAIVALTERRLPRRVLGVGQ